MMKLLCVLILTSIYLVSIHFTEGKNDHAYDLKKAHQLFHEFQTYYKKNYTTEEEKRRSKIFHDNLIRINAINQNFPKSWLAVIGPYADLTYFEFQKLRNYPRWSEKYNGTRYRPLVNCTDRRTYLFERFSKKVKDNYDRNVINEPEYYSDEN